MMTRIIWGVLGTIALLALVLVIASVQILGRWGIFLPRHADDFDQFVTHRQDVSDIPGIAMGVVTPDGVVWDEYYGTYDGDAPVTEETLFAVASVSKTVVGTAIMQLWEDGAFELDDDVNEYLSFEVRNPNHPNEPITFRQLMTHYSSITEQYPLYDDLYTIESGGGDSEWTLAEFYEAYLTPSGSLYSTDNFLESRPGETNSYSNYGNALLALLVEEISGQPYHEYVKQEIFDPLGMAHSYYLIADFEGVESEVALPYSRAQEAFIPHYSFPDYPAGSLHTTVNDMGRYMAFYLDPAAAENPILKPEAVDLMFANHGPSTEVGETETGLVWTHFDWIFFEATGHTGGDFGQSAYLFLYPDEGYGTFYVANSAGTSVIIERNILSRLKQEAERIVAESP